MGWKYHSSQVVASSKSPSRILGQGGASSIWSWYSGRVRHCDRAADVTMTKSATVVASDGLAASRYAGLSMGGWRWIGALALIALAAVLPFALSKYQVFELTMVMIYAIAVLGLNILTGYNGQISLGHGAFFAAGAYTAAILMHRYGMPYWATVPPAALICFVLGVLFGLPALRLEGPYLALVTLAMALATPQLLKYFDTWTGGVQGINLVKPLPPPGLGIDRDRWLYLLAALRIAANMLYGRTGRALVAIRDNPIAATAMGINTARYKTLAFGISTLFTGVAGALAAIVIGYVSPESYSLFLSLSFLVGSAVGGIATIGGAIVGGFFIQFVPNLANDISDAAPGAIYGLAMLLFMYAMPRGVVGSLGPWVARSMRQIEQHRVGFRRK
jgi:branched-chain amino acid transport system permease protein